MPTSKKRIQIPVSDRVHKELEKLAKRKGLSLSSLTHDLLEEALELQEDIYFSRTADKALKEASDEDLISHEDAWS
ncbi:MAG: toxin-antitoxin system, antitoxin component [Halobacteriovoraceae bacterium]|jgi:predicted DNA-binding protein|nr:toxin-antitoxin system, antitoxin component [Halobacteriovoraceae bacterium]